MKIQQNLTLPFDHVPETPRALPYDPARIDEAGALKAQIDILESRLETIKKALDATGLIEFEGTLFRATLSKFERTSYDDAVKEQIELFLHKRFTVQYLTAHTKKKPVVRLNINSKRKP